MTIAQGTKYAKHLVESKKYGYSQGSGKKDGRWSGLDYEPGNFDCSAASGAIALKSKFLTREELKGTWYSGNIISRLVASGMYYGINISKLPFATQKSMVQNGDHVRGPGHVVYGIGGGKVVSFEKSEKGTTHGKVGNQTGKEAVIRTFFSRSKGWTHIARPYSPAHFLGKLLADYAKERSRKRSADLIARRSGWDGPRWVEFVNLWESLDRGLSMEFTPKALPTDAKHVIVVLGSGLKVDGSITAKFKRRLDLAIKLFKLNPQSTVLVTGGAPKAGKTEAAFGAAYLKSQGLPDSRILQETKSNSTIGNAKNSLPIIFKFGFDKVTLVSDASHLRRAMIEFRAAQAQLECADNKRRTITWFPPLAHNDYGDAKVKPMLPVSKATRDAVAQEVATLLGVLAHYKAAL